MQELSLELAIGDTVQIGDHRLTVIDIEGDEIQFDLESDGELTPPTVDDNGSGGVRPPR